MIIETRSVPGERMAPAAKAPTTAKRRNRASSAGADHVEPREDDDDQRQLERDPQRQHDLQHEVEVVVVGDERLDRLGLEAEEHLQRLRHDEDVGHGRARQEQQQADEQRRHERPLLPRVQRRGQERPELPEDDRRGEDQADDEAELEDDHDRFGGAGDDQLPTGAGQIRSDRLLEEIDELELLHQPEAGPEPDHDRPERAENAPAELLEVIEEGHLPGRAGHAAAAPGLNARAPSGDRGPARPRPTGGTSAPRAGTRPWPSRCPSGARRAARGCTGPTGPGRTWRYRSTTCV